MAKAYLILGNIKTLVLSWNELSSVDGLDRLYSLERLALDHNKISYLQDVAGLASLPELMQLEMRGNPIEANGKCAVLLCSTPPTMFRSFILTCRTPIKYSL